MREERKAAEAKSRLADKWDDIIRRLGEGESVPCEHCGEPLRKVVEGGAYVIRCEKKCSYVRYCT